MARVCIGWLLVTGRGDGDGSVGFEEEEDGCADIGGDGGWVVGDGEGGGGEFSGCTCAELDNISVELISDPLVLTCSPETEFAGEGVAFCDW